MRGSIDNSTVVVLPVHPVVSVPGKTRKGIEARFPVLSRNGPDRGCPETARKGIRMCTFAAALVQENNGRYLCGRQGSVEVLGEIVQRCRGIDDEDRLVHPAPDDLAGKPEPLLPRGAVHVELMTVQFHAPEVKGHGRSPAGTSGLHML